MAARGYTLVLNDIKAGDVGALAQQIAGAPGAAAAIAEGLTENGFVEDMVHETEARFGRLDVIVHSAGLFPKLSFSVCSLSDLDRVMAVNFRVAVALALPGRPVMAGQAGAMVFLTSGSGLLTAVADPMQANFSFYSASKTALDRWALGMAAELAGDDIAVNSITSGAFVETLGVMALDLREASERPGIAPQKVAEAVAWLANACARLGSGSTGASPSSSRILRRPCVPSRLWRRSRDRRPCV